jgi:V/A-type H+-transporting ATPase subunit C
MNSVMAYSGIVTKIRAMRGKLLKEEDYQTIASMRPVSEVFSYLRENTSYGRLLDRMDDSLYHRGNIEKVLIQSLYDDYTGLYRFSNQKQREFLRLYKKRYEVDLINHCLRMVFHHYGVTFDLDYKKPFFNQYSNLDIDRLITSSTLNDLVENLSGTEYYVPLLRIQKAGAEQFFDYDLALNLYYFSTIWKDGKKMLAKGDLKLFQKNLGTEIDCLNLQWIYRVKKYYHMSEADLFSMLVPIRYHLSMQDCKALVGATSVEDFFHILNDQTFYGKKYSFDEEHGIEEVTKKWTAHLYETAYRNHPYSVASIYNYLYLKEQEIHTITTAIECIRYGLSESETLAYIREGRAQT